MEKLIQYRCTKVDLAAYTQMDEQDCMYCTHKQTDKNYVTYTQTNKKYKHTHRQTDIEIQILNYQ